MPSRWESWILDSGQLLYVRQGAVAVLMYVHEGGRVQKTMKDDSSHTRQKPRRPPTCASVQNNVYESEDSDAMMDGPCPSHQITTLRSILIPGRKLRTGRKVGRGRFFLPYLLTHRIRERNRFSVLAPFSPPRFRNESSVSSGSIGVGLKACLCQAVSVHVPLSSHLFPPLLGTQRHAVFGWIGGSPMSILVPSNRSK